MTDITSLTRFTDGSIAGRQVAAAVVGSLSFKPSREPTAGTQGWNRAPDAEPGFRSGFRFRCPDLR